MGKSGSHKKAKTGYLVLAALLVIEIVEYLVGTLLTGGALPYLALLAIVGAWPILYYFMHIGELRRPKE